MKNLKTIFAVLLLAIGVTMPVSAQEAKSDRVAPYNFIGVQGGVQNTLNNQYNNWKTFTPTAAISLGRMFCPEVGVRLNVNGMWNKGAASAYKGDTDYYNFNYATTGIDVMPNLCTIFGRKDYYPVNLYFILGMGWFHAWNNTEAQDLVKKGYYLPNADNATRDAFNGRLGLQLEADLCKNLALNLEGSYNMHAGQGRAFTPEDRQLLLMAGLTYKFGHKKAARNEANDYVDFSDANMGTDAAAAKAKDYEVVIDTIWYDDVEYKDVQKIIDIDKRIFFNIAQSNIESTDAQAASVAEFLKGVQNAQITITSYADRGTGNPTINMEYSKKRAEKTRQALIDRGVDPSIIKSVEWKGDTVQPYPDDNDKNRVSIITGRGVSKQQEKYTVKRFKLQEKKVRVQ